MPSSLLAGSIESEREDPCLDDGLAKERRGVGANATTIDVARGASRSDFMVLGAVGSISDPDFPAGELRPNQINKKLHDKIV